MPGRAIFELQNVPALTVTPLIDVYDVANAAIKIKTRHRLFVCAPGFSPSRNEAPGPPTSWNIGGTSVTLGRRKRAKPTPMMRAFGSERFSGTYNVPNSKTIVSP